MDQVTKYIFYIYDTFIFKLRKNNFLYMDRGVSWKDMKYNETFVLIEN